MTVEVSMKLSQKATGKLYMKAMRLEDENKQLRELLKEASDYLDTNNITSIGHGSVLHRKFKDVAPK
jgi:S-adenosylmethionine/arginine decarboxylase-like enzyme